MEITLIQGILLAVMAVIVGLDFFLEAFFIFRPLMVSTFTGLILGDVVLGLKVGALIELAFAGLTPAGGTQPPNPVFAGLMGTVLAYTTGCAPEAALGLCLPFSFLDNMLSCSIILHSHSLCQKQMMQRQKEIQVRFVISTLQQWQSFHYHMVS